MEYIVSVISVISVSVISEVSVGVVSFQYTDTDTSLTKTGFEVLKYLKYLKKKTI
jgi:hypothetical protein